MTRIPIEYPFLIIPLYKKILVILFFCIIDNHGVAASLSFDTLFPLTWYEKGLHATINAWDMIQKHFPLENVDKLDVLIGKCAFAYFCLENMHKNRQIIVDEDISYFSLLLLAIINSISLSYFNSGNKKINLTLYLNDQIIYH